MKNDVRVSVIIPTYNRAYILGEALESVFAQTFDDFEVIVVDDGSTDNTAEIVKRFRDRRLRYIRKENGGCGSAYNAGIRASRAEYLSLLDSDDLWKPDKLEREVSFFDRNPEIGSVFSDMEKFDSSKRTASFMRESPTFCRLLNSKSPGETTIFSQREIFLCLLSEVPIKTSALAMRRSSALATALYDESWPSGNDWKFLLDFSRQFRFAYIDRPLAVVRIQVDATHRRHFVRDKVLVIDMLRSEIDRIGDDREARDAAHWGISHLTKHLSWYYLDRGERLRAAAALLRGFAYTSNPGLLARALGAALLPDRIRTGIRSLLANSHPSLPTP